MKPRVLIISGPTASGKSSLALSVAEKFGGEIVSADSMQIYRGMDIGTAKPTAAEQKKIPHHFIDVVDPTETFTLSDYLEQIGIVIDGIISRGHLPVVCGGTGLYVSSFVNNVSLTKTASDPEYRRYLVDLAEREGGEKLLEMLREIDPETAAVLHSNDIKRLTRALEIYRETGKTMAEQKKLSRLTESPYSFLWIGLNYRDREALYERIDRRVDMMFDEGLEAEVRGLYESGRLVFESTAGQAIGYKEFLPYFNGDCSIDEVRETIKRESRRYAKRQLTWFRREDKINWIYPDTDDCPDATAYELIRRFTETE